MNAVLNFSYKEFEEMLKTKKDMLLLEMSLYDECSFLDHVLWGDCVYFIPVSFEKEGKTLKFNGVIYRQDNKSEEISGFMNEAGITFVHFPDEKVRVVPINLNVAKNYLSSEIRIANGLAKKYEEILSYFSDGYDSHTFPQ